MGQFRIEVTDKAEKDLGKHFKSGNIATIKRLKNSLKNYMNTRIPEQVNLNSSGTIYRVIGQEG